MAAPTNRESDKFMLRLPEGMRDRIKTAAESNNRSMNAEIVAALEASFPEPFKKKSLREALAETNLINDELERAISRWLRMRRQAHFYRSDDE